MPDKTATDRFEIALQQADAEPALYHLAKSLKQEGMSQSEMYRLFKEGRSRLATKLGDEDSPQYDAVLDTMDCIVGWGNRSNWIFDQPLHEAFKRNDGSA